MFTGNGHTSLGIMSNLIPTPRTDKNGRSVVRHMKAELTTSQPRTPMPTVGILAQHISDRDALHSYFMKTWKSFDGEELTEALKLLQGRSEGILPMLHNYLTSGNSSTHAYIDGHIGASIMELIKAMGRSSYDPDWQDHCGDILSPRFRTRTSRLWHALTVADESGYEWNDVEELARWTRSTQSLIVYNVDLPQEESYWRGMTALALLQLRTGNEILWNEKDLIEQIPGFVELAGTHDDLIRVMAVAVPRYLIDADAIRDILRQQDDTPSAVGSGIL